MEYKKRYKTISSEGTRLMAEKQTSPSAGNRP